MELAHGKCRYACKLKSNKRYFSPEKLHNKIFVDLLPWPSWMRRHRNRSKPVLVWPNVAKESKTTDSVEGDFARKFQLSKCQVKIGLYFNFERFLSVCVHYHILNPSVGKIMLTRAEFHFYLALTNKNPLRAFMPFSSMAGQNKIAL